MVSRRSQVLMLSLAAAAIGAVAFAISPRQKPRAGSPEQAVALLVAASQAKDIEAALALHASPFREVIEWYCLAEEHQNDAMAAIEARFGRQSRDFFRMELLYDLKRIRGARILSKEVVSDVRVKLQVEELVGGFEPFEENLIVIPYVAVKQDGSWKLFRTCTLLQWGASIEQSKARAPSGREIIKGIVKLDRDVDEFGEPMRQQIEEQTKMKIADAIAVQRQARLAVKPVLADIRAGRYPGAAEADIAQGTAYHGVTGMSGTVLIQAHFRALKARGTSAN